MKQELVILGAGITGISACYHARKLGINAVAYEAESEPGGLLNSFEIDGFRFDNAVHLSFTEDEYVRSIFDKTAFIVHPPTAYCYESKNWLKHPVQNNLYPLTTKEKVDLIESFIDRPNIEPKNYFEWLLCQFGEKITSRYLNRYTRKYWCIDPKELSLNWISNRVRKSQAREILYGALERIEENHYYSTEMRYPENGGYKSFIQPLIYESEIICNKQVSEIDVKQKKVCFTDGTDVRFNYLINTLPLPAIAKLIKGVPERVALAASQLSYTTLDLVSVGFNKEGIPPYLWFYIYDEDMIPARAYSPSIKSSDNVPSGFSSLQFEIYNLNSAKMLNGDKLVENVRKSLIEMGICEEKDIKFLHHKFVPYANVVFTNGMEEHRSVILDYLKSEQIVSCGRFGEWDYFWSDQSLLSGKKAAETIIEMRAAN